MSSSKGRMRGRNEAISIKGGGEGSPTGAHDSSQIIM